MKTQSKFFVLGALALGIGLNSCKKSSSSPTSGGGPFAAKASFTITGGKFSNQAVTISGIDKGLSHCYYWPKYKITDVDVEDATSVNTDSKNALDVVFNGNTASKQKAGDDINGGPFSSVYFTVDVTAKDGTKYNGYFSDATNTPGTITITKFGGVGDTVEGTFSGKLMDENGNYNLTVTNGTFTITRANDLN